MNLSKLIVADFTPTTSTRFCELYIWSKRGFLGKHAQDEHLNTHVIVLFHFQIL